MKEILGYMTKRKPIYLEEESEATRKAELARQGVPDTDPLYQKATFTSNQIYENTKLILAALFKLGPAWTTYVYTYVVLKTQVDRTKIGGALCAFRALVSELAPVVETPIPHDTSRHVAGWELAMRYGLISFKDPSTLEHFTGVDLRGVEIRILTSIPDDDADEKACNYTTYTLAELEEMAIFVNTYNLKNINRHVLALRVGREVASCHEVDSYRWDRRAKKVDTEVRRIWYLLLERLLRYERKGSINHAIQIPFEAFREREPPLRDGET